MKKIYKLIKFKIKLNLLLNIIILKSFFPLNLKKDKRPKISIFIPIYNKEKFINRCIHSVQAQTLKDIEIIAVNDFSNDSSLKILESLTKTDNRIKIINNDKNYGLLYSRAMGILKSSGEYLMNLDADDELKGYNSLKSLYYKAIRYNIDIITFSFKDIKNNKSINICNKLNIIQKQPQLFKSIFGSTNEIKDYYIWNKIIKRETFQKAFEAFKKEIYSLKWNYFEDDIWNILVNRFAKSKLCISRVIYIYNYNEDSLMNKRLGITEFKNLIFRHEMYKKIFANKENEKYLIAEYFFLFNRLDSKKIYILLMNNQNINNKIINIFKTFLKKYDYTDIKRNNITNLINFFNHI